MNKKSFSEKMAILEAYYGYRIPKGAKNEPNLFQFYWDSLKKYTEEEWDGMVITIKNNWRPTSTVKFPLIVDFREAIGHDSENRAQLAIFKIKEVMQKHGAYSSVNFGDRAMHATIVRFGGWQEMCKWEKRDWDINEGRFINAYKTALLNPEMGPDYLPGFIEIENRKKGLDKFIPGIESKGGSTEIQALRKGEQIQ